MGKISRLPAFKISNRVLKSAAGMVAIASCFWSPLLHENNMGKTPVKNKNDFSFMVVNFIIKN
jgi:hypothetical protein